MNRREWLAGAGGLVLGACATPPSAAADPLAGAALMQDVRTFVGFGVHRSGGAGDVATTEWFARRWNAMGYDIEHMPFDTPNADTTRAEVIVAGKAAVGIGQPPLVMTPPEGIESQVALWSPASPGDVAGKIALVTPRPLSSVGFIPFADYRAATDGAAKAGAVAAICIMETPSGLPAFNNTPLAMKPSIPVLSLGLAQAGPDFAQRVVGRRATIYIEGPGGVRKARNTIARAGKAGPWVIVSTPQSGWFTCGGERGPGIAMALALADWARRQDFPNRLLFVATSGHEWQDAGAHLFHEHAAPKPGETALWLHLGASYAARGYQKIGAGAGPETIRLTDAVSDVRAWQVSADLMADAKAAFAGLPGLAQPQLATVEASAGELTLVLKEGYRTAGGFFGMNPLFHTAIDGANSTSGAIMEPVARALATMLKAHLAKG